MNWLWFAIYNIFALTIWYLFHTHIPNQLPTHYSSKIFYACFVLVYAGFFAALCLVFLYFKFPKQMHILLTEYKEWLSYEYVIPGIISPTIAIANVFALTGGGGIAISVVNLNMITTLIMSSILFNFKINSKIVLASLAGVAGISYATYESIKLN